MGTFVQQDWLSAATPGTVSDVEEVAGSSTYGWQISATGSGVVRLWLEGSIDGSTWCALDAYSSNYWPPPNPTTRWVTNMPVKFLRVNFYGGDEGTTATVSVIAV